MLKSSGHDPGTDVEAGGEFEKGDVVPAAGLGGAVTFTLALLALSHPATRGLD